ncbi:MAG: hypothetical protein HFI09_01115 [Bacilli bacterium]|nr:hypothetical protein [Bacilli bacterium]
MKNLVDLEKMPYKQNLLLRDDLIFQGKRQQIYFSKHTCDSEEMDRFYLKLITKCDKGVLEKQGYLYFYLDMDSLTSKLVGFSVKDEYRNTGLGSLLISSWLLFCMDQGILKITSHHKQRKPFLIYLLKKFYFESMSNASYIKATRKVYICKLLDYMDKYVIFEDKYEREHFSRINVIERDNYRIADFYTPGIEILDEIILGISYELKDKEQGYKRALRIYKEHQR